MKWGILFKSLLWSWLLDPIGREHFNKFLEVRWTHTPLYIVFLALPCTEKQVMALCTRCRQRSLLLPFCEVYSASWVYFFFKHLISRTHITSNCTIDLLACSSLGFITGNLFEEELYSTNWHQGFCKTLCGGRITGFRCFYHMKSGVQLYMTKMFNKSKTLNRKDPGSCWCPIKNILAQLISYLDFSVWGQLPLYWPSCVQNDGNRVCQLSQLKCSDFAPSVVEDGWIYLHFFLQFKECNHVIFHYSDLKWDLKISYKGPFTLVYKDLQG